MGILTVMKLSVFAISVLSLLLALTWFMIYCPTGTVGYYKGSTALARKHVRPKSYYANNPKAQ